MKREMKQEDQGAPAARLQRAEQAEKAWNTAYDRALNADKKAGRPYDRHRYARLAHVASVKVLRRCWRATCSEQAPCIGCARILGEVRS